MLTVISMFSPCAQWVFGPLSPVCGAVDDGFEIASSFVDSRCKAKESSPLVAIQVLADLGSILAIVGIFGRGLNCVNMGMLRRICRPLNRGPGD